jgi:hypothetical protein
MIDMYWDRFLAQAHLAPGQAPDTFGMPYSGVPAEDYRRLTAYKSMVEDHLAAHPEDRAGGPARATEVFGKAAVEDYMALQQEVDDSLAAYAKAKTAAMTPADWQAAANNAQKSIDYNRGELARLDTADPQYAIHANSIAIAQGQLDLIRRDHRVSPQ